MDLLLTLPEEIALAADTIARRHDVKEETLEELYSKILEIAEETLGDNYS